MNGTLYGTTEYGGRYYGSGSCPHCGTVFKITTSGKEKVLHSFGKGTDGSLPLGGLIYVPHTTGLYGTTAHGGTYNNLGTIFSITPSGAETVLHSFCTYCDSVVTDGTNPATSVIFVNGTLYGTTYLGGAYYTGGQSLGSLCPATSEPYTPSALAPMAQIPAPV